MYGAHTTDNLKWDNHVNHLASSCYGVLAALRKIKKLTNHHLKKFSCVIMKVYLCPALT